MVPRFVVFVGCFRDLFEDVFGVPDFSVAF